MNMSFISGFGLGMLLQFSIGPVFFGVINVALTRGFREGMKMTLGVTLGDGIYIALSMTTLTALFHFPALRLIISLTGAVVLLIWGIRMIRNARQRSESGEAVLGNSFFSGLKITLLNPMSIIFWSGIFASAMALKKWTDASGPILYASGCLFSTVFFLGLVCLFGSFVKRWLKVANTPVIDYILGALFVFFGLRLIISQITTFL
ncbi:LysE family translocator [Sporolactobacillus spathodeae]